MTQNARISIIVPAYNEERLLGPTLDSIRAAAVAFADRRWDWELIVCDNNSTDRTAETAAGRGAKVVFEPINQIARARNRGADAASGDWLIFVDADSHPSQALFGEVGAAIGSGGVLAGGATVRLQGHHPRGNLITHLWNGISRTCRWVAGSFIFCETAAFREIGGFSERLFASEEIDLSKRLKRLAQSRGKRIMILTRHPIVTSARKLHLYTPGEHFRFLLRTVLAGGRTLASRDECHTWYDGRR
jgi:glycosyltransferase involved in cell wall biosynthesis